MFGAPLASFFSGVFGYILLGIQILVICDIFCKWSGNQEKPFPKAVGELAERIYGPIRKVTKLVPGPFDLAPVVTLILVIALERGLAAAMFAYAKSLLGM